MAPRTTFLFALLVLSLSLPDAQSRRKYCGSDFLDTVTFICGSRGIYQHSQPQIPPQLQRNGIGCLKNPTRVLICGHSIIFWAHKRANECRPLEEDRSRCGGKQQSRNG